MQRFLTFLFLSSSITLMLSCVHKEEHPTRRASMRHMRPAVIGYYSYYHAETDSGHLIRFCLDSILSEGKVQNLNDKNCDPDLISKNRSGKLQFVEVRKDRIPGRVDSLFYVAHHSKKFVLKDTPHEVYRFQLSNPPIDGRQIRFWTPEFGFLLWENPDWLDESSLITLDGSSSEDIAQLIQMIKKDTLFFTGGE